MDGLARDARGITGNKTQRLVNQITKLVRDQEYIATRIITRGCHAKRHQ